MIHCAQVEVLGQRWVKERIGKELHSKQEFEILKMVEEWKLDQDRKALMILI
jgi:hypothetical protein